MFFSRINPKEHILPFSKSDLLKKHPQIINEWLHLCQISERDIHSLHKINDIMKEHAPIIADRHYQMIMEIPEIRDIFETHSVYERYTSLITKYFQQLTNPTLDEDYIQYRKKIGRIHSQINLTDDWYIGSYTRVYEYLTPFIIAKFHSKPGELADILVALNRIITFDSLIVLSAYQEANDFHLVESISSVTDSVMKADKVKHLLDHVQSTVEETANVTAAAEQLTASVKEVSVSATEVSHHADDMIQDAKKGEAIIEDSLQSFLHMAKEFDVTKAKIDHLLVDIQEIFKVVDLIEHIAEETNLLSLNASIEAARAGESGRGFAVVASEIRKLAEQTKTSVQQIGDMIKHIQTNSNDVGITVDSVSSSIGSRTTKVKETIGTMNQIMEEIQQVGESMKNITSIAQEQTAATQDIANRMFVIQDYTEKVKDSTHQTGESIYNSSKEIDDLRKETIKTIPELTTNQLLRITETDHRLQKWHLYNMLLGYENNRLKEELNISNCSLTTWIHHIMKQNNHHSSDLENIHVQFHQLANEVIRLNEKHQFNEASEKMLEVETLSNKLQESLQQIRANV